MVPDVRDLLLMIVRLLLWCFPVKLANEIFRLALRTGRSYLKLQPSLESIHIEGKPQDLSTAAAKRPCVALWSRAHVGLN